MVQISIFDFESPPEPISGEAFTLSPLDVLIFTPIGAIRTGAEKVSANIFTSIGKFFAPKAILPTTKLVTSATIGARFPGAPLRTVASVGGEKSSVFGLSQVEASTSIFSKFTVPKLASPFTGKIPTKGALVLGGIGLTTASIFQLTGTQEGRDLAAGVGDFTENITKFATENPLIIAGIVGIILIGAIK